MTKTPTEHRYIRGEMLVLKNSMGGRLFIVYEHTDEGVIEKATVPSQQKYMSPTPLWQLVKVGSAAETEKVLESFRQITLATNNKIQAINSERDKLYAEILGVYIRKD